MARVQIDALEPFLWFSDKVYKCSLFIEFDGGDRFCQKAIGAVKVS